MRAPHRHQLLSYFLVGFFLIVFAIAYFLHPRYPILILGGENSVGTWMSGVLLVMSATLTGAAGLQRGLFPWLLFTCFFLLLAIDERFMIHEAIKRQIIFSNPSAIDNRWITEIPVIFGSILGGIVAVFLWRNFRPGSQFILLIVVVLGSISVVVDILSLGILWEEACKLTAELLMTSVLLREVASSPS